MTRKIKIRIDDIEEIAELYDNTVADDIWNALPIEGKAARWGDEMFFPISVRLGYKGKQEVVKIGELALWEPGHAFCIFFGKTPASSGNEPRPSSPVNVFGKIKGNAKIFKKVSDGDCIKIYGV